MGSARRLAQDEGEGGGGIRGVVGLRERCVSVSVRLRFLTGASHRDRLKMLFLFSSFACEKE